MRACSPHNQCRGRLSPKYRFSGVTALLRVHPYYVSPLEKYDPPREAQGMRELFPDAIKERNNGGASTPGFYSNVCLVCKTSRGLRPVIDLKGMNTHLNAPHLHIFTINSVLSTVKKEEELKIDLEIPIHPDSRKYLRFAYKNRVYQFPVLPFGLNTAPQVFTSLGLTCEPEALMFL